MKRILGALLGLFICSLSQAQGGNLKAIVFSSEGKLLKSQSIIFVSPDHGKLLFETNDSGFVNTFLMAGNWEYHVETKHSEVDGGFIIQPGKSIEIKIQLQEKIIVDAISFESNAVKRTRSKDGVKAEKKKLMEKSKMVEKKRKAEVRAERGEEIEYKKKAEVLELRTTESIAEFEMLKSAPTKADYDGIDDFAGDKSIEAEEMVIVASAGATNIKAGTLTAGEINDFSKWTLWEDINKTDLASHIKTWGIHPKNRFCVQLQNENKFPVVDALVELLEENKVIMSAKTDNTGKAELWSGLYSDTKNSNLKIRVIKGSTEKEIPNAKPFSEGINHLSITSRCGASNNVDITFVVDATGSMGDEIQYLKMELADVIGRVVSKNSKLDIKTGSVFYRDVSDSYTTKISPLSKNISQTTNFIKNQNAGGGGDFPEAVDEALKMATMHMGWREKARARIIFLVLDAPPHKNPKQLEAIQKAVTEASKKGIRIVPVVGSGIDKSTEYLMRSIALATNGTYTFLTDDSGVGGSHITPTTDEFEVEKLNDLMVRIITQYTKVADCQFNKNQPEPSDSSSFNFTENQKKIEIKYFPNPTKGEINISSNEPLDQLFISDLSGKVLIKFNTNNQNRWQGRLDNYPSGIYLIRYYLKDKDRWYGEKLVLIH